MTQSISAKLPPAALPRSESVKAGSAQDFAAVLDGKRNTTAARGRGTLMNTAQQLKFANNHLVVTGREIGNLKILLNSKTESSLPKHLKPLLAKYERDMTKIFDKEDSPGRQSPARDLSFAKMKVDLTDKLYNDIRHYAAQSKNPFAQRVIAAIGGQAGLYAQVK